ncbi:uncharacterized protein LOC133514982 [Syngnathoides biaculeatus]|uniref:uncharacterized protein LOC133514982 n=1 Tax=Syngnathoides biaculeatus TaxID=300417 RepID=UPI002ADDC377|nr:uncharacterized protein LOC133514982 [Syngnathoides biaculeatus]
MDLMEMEDMGSGCGDDHCGLASRFLEDCSGPDCDWEEPIFGFTELVCVTILYIPVMLLGLLGNVLTILVVSLRPHMRSSTYLYLSSMAVSDLMILLLLPLDLYKLWRPRPWPLGDLACKMTMFLSECCTFCTILHITFLSLERYVAVCWPMTTKTWVTRRRTRALIGCLWLGAAVSAAPVLVMVGVEEVGQEDLRVSGWGENELWMGEDGEQVGFTIDGDEGRRVLSSFDGERKWGEKQEQRQSQRDRELKWFEEEEAGMQAFDEQSKKHRNGRKNDKQEDVKEVYGDQQNKMKEDEGGGWEAKVARHETWSDRRECRCTQYAISSGLLSAMMILSNLYFLVPVCILGLVYSLIGRTLWLRPQCTRRDQSHRNTVKMLGVIVLAFVLCWLPFHVGRTIFVFSLGTRTDQQTVNSGESIHNQQNITKTVFSNLDVNATSGYSYKPPSRSQQLDPSSDTGPHIVPNAIAHKYSAHTRLRSRYYKHNSNYEMYNSTRTQMPQGSDTSPLLSSHNVTTANTHIGKSKFGDVHTTNRTLKSTATCVDSQSDSAHNHTPSTKQSSLHAVKATGLSNDTHFTNHTHTDSRLYFLYYLSQYFNLGSSVLYYLSAAVNPLLYNVMSARYRHAVHSLFHADSQRQGQHLRSQRTTSYM